MRVLRTLILVLVTLLGMSAAPAYAKHHRTHAVATDASGNASCRHNTVPTPTAYGITICVDPTYASKFQAFFAALHARGVVVRSIVCQAYGHAPGSNHVGGGACDVDQRARNRTISAMYHAGDLIREAGLYDGCSFRDCGHVEAMRGLGNYGTTRTYSARSRNRREASAVRRASSDYMVRMSAAQ